MNRSNHAFSEISPEEIHAPLIQAAQGAVNDDNLARIVSSWVAGLGAMPDWLGLGENEYRSMMAFYFPDAVIEPLPQLGNPLDPQRQPEINELLTLLLANRSVDDREAYWLSRIVAVACVGNDHLWQDMGLWSRNDLSRFMRDNFHSLAERNVKDMKWKKFLYKQLCETEGIYTCRSPSCEVCADYAACFGPEE